MEIDETTMKDAKNKLFFTTKSLVGHINPKNSMVFCVRVRHCQSIVRDAFMISIFDDIGYVRVLDFPQNKTISW
jgi:hypothetical protein